MDRPDPNRHKYVLYIAGATVRSRRAIENMNQLIHQRLGEVDLEIVDIYQNPARTRDHQILVAPCLVREWPQPQRILVGDLSDQARVLAALNLRRQEVSA